MEKLFKLKQNGTTVRTEIVAGITTFLAMAYILAVNPSILSAAGMPSDAIFAATAISAAFATLIMAFFANYPVVLASGMGLNAYFAFSVVPQLANAGVTDPWRVALTAILCEGVIFIILSIFRFRETLVNKVPTNLKLGISAGIGLFIVIVGFKGAGIVDTDAYFDGTAVQSSTLVKLGNVGSAPVVLAFVGIIIIAALWHFKVKGSILIGILATWILGIIAQLKELAETEGDNVIAQVKELQQKWNQVGHVPFRDKEALYKEYRAVCDKLYDAYGVSQAKRRLNNFRQNLQQRVEKEAGSLDTERQRMQRAYERMQNEIKTYENNIGFLSVGSKKGNSLIESMNKKVEKLRDELNLLAQKIKAVDEQMTEGQG